MSDRTRADVAIVGMSCILPGAGDLGEFWRNLRSGTDAITEVPEGRWEPEFYDPGSDAVDRLYCNRGGFIDSYARIDPLKWGMMPVAVDGGEPDQMLVLEVAGRALTDAGYADSDIPRDRTGVMLGRGGYMSAGIRRYSMAATHAQELVGAVRSLVPDIDEQRLARVKAEYLSGLPDLRGGNVIGLVPNLAASRVANRLDLQGPAYTVDAACASSLVALDNACSELLRDRCDLVLVGGVHVGMGPAFWSVFCQLGALSRTERIRPFDRSADGLLIGEGVGMVVLKRLEDAVRDDDRIYAVIRGSGVSSDGREASVMQPRPAGQTLAVRRAWSDAGIDPTAPGAIGFLEAHGTATLAGDAAEVATLREVFGARERGVPRAGLGSVKSMIGHAMPAAGVAGLIKAALAVHHRTLLPTLHVEEPRDDLESTRFRVIAEAEEWPGGSEPRRAGINAFGFGGINAHVVLEEAPGRGGGRGSGRVTAATFTRRPPPGEADTPDVRRPALFVSGETQAEILEALEAGGSRFGRGPCRLVVVDPTPERIERARKVVGLGGPFRDRKGHVWFNPEGEITRGGGVAFLYPGLDAGPPSGVDEVARAFGRPGLPDYDADDLEEVGAAIVLAADTLTAILGELGVEPDVLAGHSIGEWSAMIAAGVLPRADAMAILHTVTPGHLEFPDVVFATVGAGLDRLAPFLDRSAGVTVALDNCPHQSVVCGPASEVDDLLGRLRASGVLCQELAFRSGFHSPYFEDFLEPVRERVSLIDFGTAACPVWSATTCEPFPADPAEIRRLFLDHLVRTVRFRELTGALYARGTRAFVQVGGGNLVGFVDDSLREEGGHFAMATSSGRAPGVEQLRRLVAGLWAEGLDLDFERLLTPMGADGADAGAGSGRPDAREMRLELGTPLGRVSTPLPVRDGGLAGLEAVSDDPVVAEFARVSQALEEVSREVVNAWRGRGDGSATLAPRSRTFVRHLSLDTYPELRDHSLFPTPPGWPKPEDGFPVVPMTMSIDLMIEAAEELVPGKVAVAVEGVRAYRWMAVDDPLDLEIRAEFDGVDLVSLRLGEFLEGRVRLADSYPEPPLVRGGVGAGQNPVGETAAEMYGRRLMFHGPAYRSVDELLGIADDTVRGRVEALGARGALLDGCGQILGYWIKRNTVVDRLAFPVMIDDLRIYGPHPEVGSRLECTVWVRHFGKSQIRADFEVARNGRVWAYCEGWQDRRFRNDERMWPVIQKPEDHILSEEVEGVDGACWLRNPIDAASTRDSFARRYLGRSGFLEFDAMPEGSRKSDWLAGRIAAKDAVRQWLWCRGHGSIFPIEIEVDNEANGAPTVDCPYGPELHLSIAHRDGRALALVGDAGPVGVDLERIDERDEGFDSLAFSDAERAHLPSAERDVWRTRFWAAKEAAAKCRRTGLGGSPREFRIEGVEGERILCDGRWVNTRRVDGWVLAWTNGESR